MNKEENDKILNILVDKITIQYETMFKENFPNGLSRNNLVSLILSVQTTILNRILKRITPQDKTFQNDMDIFLFSLFKTISELSFIEDVKLSNDNKSNEIH